MSVPQEDRNNCAGNSGLSRAALVRSYRDPDSAQLTSYAACSHPRSLFPSGHARNPRHECGDAAAAENISAETLPPAPLLDNRTLAEQAEFRARHTGIKALRKGCGIICIQRARLKSRACVIFKHFVSSKKLSSIRPYSEGDTSLCDVRRQAP